jgi:hypothetical protein
VWGVGLQLGELEVLLDPGDQLRAETEVAGVFWIAKVETPLDSVASE